MSQLALTALAVTAATAATAGCGLILLNTPLSDTDVPFNLGPGTVPDLQGIPVFARESIFETIPGKSGSHAATLTAFDDGELLAGWYSYSGPHELDGSAIYLSRKPAGSDTWESPWMVMDRPCGDGNPVLYSEGDEVWLFQAVVPFRWSTAHIEVQRSHDRGRTWADPEIVSLSIGANVRFPPVRTATGTLLLPAYDDLMQRSLFFESDDGDCWRFRSAVASCPGNMQPSVVRLSDDRLLAVMRNAEKGWLWVTASDDNGRTWSTPADSGLPNPGSAAVILRLADGNLVLVNNNSETDRGSLSVSISADEGRTWPATRIIANGGETYSYPSAIQTADGLIHVVYTRGRERIQHVTFNEAWVTSE